MPLFTESRLYTQADICASSLKTVASELDRKSRESAKAMRFDIFLAHCSTDRRLILGLWLALEDLGFSVYIEHLQDRHLKRDNMNKESAGVLRRRMLSCKALFVMKTANDSNSVWIPWEMAFKDGHNGKTAILPIARQSTSRYVSEDIQGIYPYVTEDLNKNRERRLWIRNSPEDYVVFEKWLQGEAPCRRIDAVRGTTSISPKLNRTPW